MTMEALLTATVIREECVIRGRSSVRVRFTDCLGGLVDADCSTTFAPTAERLRSLRVGDPVAVRGHVAVVASGKKEIGALKVAITNLMILGESE